MLGRFPAVTRGLLLSSVHLLATGDVLQEWKDALENTHKSANDLCTNWHREQNMSLHTINQ